MSWAAVAKSATAPAAPTEAPPPSAEERIAIIDTNAVISGLRLEHLAERFCTIPEVIAEVRDKQSRTFLSTLPFTLDVREPHDESIRAVQRFARETGDIHSLSAVDLKLLALAHTLELAAHGTANLREHPVQLRTRQKHKSRPRALPGWGQVDNPEEWKVVDEAPEEQLTNATGGQSRIIAGVQPLSLSLSGPEAEPPSQQQQPPPQQQHPESEPSVGNVSWRPEHPLPALPLPQLQQQQHAENGEVRGGGGGGGGGAPGQQQNPVPREPPHTGEEGGGEEEVEEEEVDDGRGWEMACKSRNAARRKQRKERRRQAWMDHQPPPQQQQQQGIRVGGEVGVEAAGGGPTVSGWDAAVGGAPSTSGREEQQEGGQAGAPGQGATASALLAQQQQQQQESPKQQQQGLSGGPHETSAGVASLAAEGLKACEEGGRSDGEGDEGDGGGSHGEVDEDETGEEEEFDGFELVTDEDEGEGEGEERDGVSEAGTTATGVTDTTVTATAASATAVEGSPAAAWSVAGTEAELLPNTTSNVFTVTADFAMQNVMLQMGLRLVSRDGKQITRVSRWALRCSACFFVTKEAGRLFCPRCGNMTMDKVEVTVGPGGAEFFGVRKKFVLRGTRFSLPKPKSGRGARSNPVLREDVLLARTGGLNRPGAAKKAAAGELLDPFTAEFGSETWHQAVAAAGGRAGGRRPPRGVMLTSWKNNPNEVKPQRKSRRK